MVNRWFVWAFAALVLAGCTRTEVTRLQAVDSKRADVVFIAEDVDFGQYRKLSNGGLSLYYPQTLDLTPADEQRIRDIFRDSFFSELEDYPIVETPDERTLLVNATLVDMLGVSSTYGLNLGTYLEQLVEPGKLTFLMEFRDGGSGRLLAHAGDTSQLVALGADRGDDWAQFRRASRHWAQQFREFADENLSR